MVISLNHLRPGKEAQVITILDCEGISDRLRSAGLQPGVVLRCCGRSQNGRVMGLLVEGSCIRLQTRDLEKIRVEI